MSVISPNLFRDMKDKIFPLEPILFEKASQGKLSGELHEGMWTDVGTKERLLNLENFSPVTKCGICNYKMAYNIFKSKYLNEKLKSFIFKYTSFGAPTYHYNVDPIQLSFLVNEIDNLDSISGNILEIGVARGMTTKFLAEHIKDNLCLIH